MNAKETKEQIENLAKSITDFASSIDLCEACKNKDMKNDKEIEECQMCCWYYDSNFKVGR